MKAIPPLSQTREGKLACAEGYALQEIDGVQSPSGPDAARGTEVHSVMAQYALRCASEHVESDWSAFDEIAKAIGPEAGEIVDGLRDGFTVDHARLFSVETWLALDEDLQPLVCQKGSAMAGRAAYEGTLDAVFMNGEDGKATIHDYKSHWRPFDADTFQSKLYPFLLMQHYHELEEVEFIYLFVRFKSARRSVTYTRDDVPKLAAEIERARKRQLAIHEKANLREFDAPDPIPPEGYAKRMRNRMDATPGSHCIYCPHLAKGTCPLGQQNPYDLSMTLEDRLRQVVFFDQARKHQLAIIKDYVDQSKTPVEFKAGEDRYTAAFSGTESGFFPLLPTVAILGEWVDAVPDDKVIFDRLRVGSTELKSKIKAKKRAALDQRLRDEVMVKETAVKFAITKNGEEEEEQ